MQESGEKRARKLFDGNRLVGSIDRSTVNGGPRVKMAQAIPLVSAAPPIAVTKYAPIGQLSMPPRETPAVTIACWCGRRRGQVFVLGHVVQEAFPADPVALSPGWWPVREPTRIRSHLAHQPDNPARTRVDHPHHRPVAGKTAPKKWGKLSSVQGRLGGTIDPARRRRLSHIWVRRADQPPSARSR